MTMSGAMRADWRKWGNIFQNKYGKINNRQSRRKSCLTSGNKGLVPRLFYVKISGFFKQRSGNEMG